MQVWSYFAIEESWFIFPDKFFFFFFFSPEEIRDCTCLWFLAERGAALCGERWKTLGVFFLHSSVSRIAKYIPENFPSTTHIYLHIWFQWWYMITWDLIQRILMGIWKEFFFLERSQNNCWKLKNLLWQPNFTENRRQRSWRWFSCAENPLCA